MMSTMATRDNLEERRGYAEPHTSAANVNASSQLQNNEINYVPTANIDYLINFI